MDVINQGMLFAATLLMCLFPFLIVVSALAGRSVVNALTRLTGLNGQATADADHMFASSGATASAVVGTASMVFFVLAGSPRPPRRSRSTNGPSTCRAGG